MSICQYSHIENQKKKSEKDILNYYNLKSYGNSLREHIFSVVCYIHKNIYLAKSRIVIADS